MQHSAEFLERLSAQQHPRFRVPLVWMMSEGYHRSAFEVADGAGHSVREILIVLLIFFGLAGLAWAVQAAQATGLIYGGVILILFGLLFSTPCAIWYHVLLYRSLKPRGALDRKWLLNPTGQHKLLLADERARVMPWFYAGAAGWVICVVGCVLLGIATLMMRGS